jgi:peptide/nickel transport system substrate-binding protein
MDASRGDGVVSRPLIVGATVMALVMAACGGGGGSSSSTTAPTRHELNLSFLQDPGQPPDPAVYYAGQGLILQDNMYDGLVQYAAGTAQRQIVPDLALSWTNSPDFKTWTFKLRTGVVFHDGTPFTSAVVAPSLARDAAVNSGPAYMAQAVAKVDTPDAQTAVLTLTSSNPVFLDYLASPYGPRMYSPPGLAAHAGTDNDQTYLQTHDLGSGPYTLTKAQVGVGYQMQAFPQYWGKQPYYTTVNLPVIDDFNTQELEFEKGQIDGILHDMTDQAIASFKGNSKYTVYTLPTLQSEYAYINPSSSFLTSAANRVAVMKAINLSQIVDSVYKGRGTPGAQLYPRNLLPLSDASQKQIGFDPSVLQGIVAKLPSNQKNFTIGYDAGSPDDNLIAEILTNDLSAAGLNVKSVGFQTSQIYGWAPPGTPQGAPDLLIEYIWPDAYDAYQWAHIALDPNGGINYLHCDVPNSSNDLSTALSNNDNSLFGKVGDTALQQGCLLNMVSSSDTFVMQPWLKGVPEGHLVVAPNSELLAGLHPG